MESLPADQRDAFKQSQRAWIKKRDEDAGQAVNTARYDSTPSQFQKAWEKALIEATRERITELEKPAAK